MKKCPSGVFCIENITLTFALLCVLIIAYFIYINSNNHNIVINNNQRETSNVSERGWIGSFMPSWPYTNVDTVLNPYSPPLRDERYFIPSGAVPINISTNIGAVDTNYRQVGILTPLNSSSKDNILPLMGRPLFTNRNKWQYYSSSNQNNNVKLPISRAGRSCTNEYGCDKLYTGDTVYIEGANETYKVTVYDNNVIKYLPFV